MAATPRLGAFFATILLSVMTVLAAPQARAGTYTVSGIPVDVTAAAPVWNQIPSTSVEPTQMTIHRPFLVCFTVCLLSLSSSSPAHASRESVTRASPPAFCAASFASASKNRSAASRTTAVSAVPSPPAPEYASAAQDCRGAGSGGFGSRQSVPSKVSTSTWSPSRPRR